MSQKSRSTLKGQYILPQSLEEALLALDVTGRPLLVKGEPGTGKTMLAEYMAERKGCKLFKWHIKSTTQAVDGLYFYDSLSRLNDARFNQDKGRDVHSIDDYIKLGPVGEAFMLDEPSVVLIDEVDKADIEFPNDLLVELDKMEFTIAETNKLVKAKVRPYFIITSNNEKELPDAFLRRCLFHYIEFPASELMDKIVRSHFPEIEENLLKNALAAFYQLRQYEDFKKPPSTSELIDWIQILLHQGGKLNSKDLRSLPFAASLLKHEDDHKALRLDRSRYNKW